MTDALTALSGSSNPATAEIERATVGLAEDFNSFLNLLTTQLQNQDPTEPLDTNQLTDQIVQFTQAEQQINTNARLEELVQLQSNSVISNSVSYIDRIVEAEGDQIRLISGDAAPFSYELDSNAQNVTVSITTPSGRVLSSFSGPTTAGTKHQLEWDGTDVNGNVVEDGTYRVNITANDAEGGDVEAKTYVSDIVTGVDIQEGETTLFFGEIEIPVSDVISVKSLNFQ